MRKLLILLTVMMLAIFACTPEKRVTTAESAEWEAHLHLDSAIEYIDHQRYEQAMIQLKTAEKLLPVLTGDISAVLDACNQISGKTAGYDLRNEAFETTTLYVIRTDFN